MFPLMWIPAYMAHQHSSASAKGTIALALSSRKVRVSMALSNRIYTINVEVLSDQYPRAICVYVMVGSISSGQWVHDIVSESL